MSYFSDLEKTIFHDFYINAATSPDFDNEY